METINTSLPFDPFAMPFGFSDPTYASEYSPISFFSPIEGFSQDFASPDSAGTPVSPASPGLSASSYGFSATDDWNSWEPIEHSPSADNFILPESFTKAPMTPAVNPMDLAIRSGLTPQPQRSQQSPLQPQPRTIAETRRPSLAISTTPTQSIERDDSTKRYPSRSLKRKSSSSASEGEASSAKRASPSPPPTERRGSDGAHPKKTAHNMIEKRYRTNLNDKITQLRDAVPSLRTTHRQAGSDAEGFMDEDFNGLAQAPKLNKATILSKATDYITQLEGRNRSLETENSALRGRVEGLEMLLMARSGATGPVWN